LIKHARQVVTVCKNGETLLKGAAMNDVCVLNGPVSVVINCDGHIGYIGKDTEVSQKFEEKEFERIVDATDCCVIPGRNIVVLEGSGGGGGGGVCSSGLTLLNFPREMNDSIIGILCRIPISGKI
jgi:hypothetical protein